MKKTITLIFLSLLLLLCGCVPGGPGQETETEAEPENTEPAYDPSDFTVEKIGTVNLAAGKFVTSDSASNESPYSSLGLTDGVTGTGGFSSAPERRATRIDHWFMVDLERGHTVSKINLYPVTEEKNAFPTELTVLVSEDGENFRPVGEYKVEKNVEPEDTGLTFDVSEENVRFVKVAVTAPGTVMKKVNGNNMIYYALSEMEVFGEIDNTENLIPSKDALWMDPDATEQLTVSYLLSDHAGDAIEWYSSDPAVADVGESGIVRAKAPGDAVIYITDGKNLAACPVKVKDLSPQFTVGVYYNAAHGVVSEETIGWLKEFGLDFIEIDHGYDAAQNYVQDWLVKKAAELGVGSVVTDGMRYAIQQQTVSDEQIAEHYSAYKNRAGVVGFFLWDEPPRMLPFSSATRVLSNLGFDAIINVNLSPQDPGKFYEMIYDYMAAMQYEGHKYLTYDQYPYVAGRDDFTENVYFSLDAIRRSGLVYHTDTGYYIQAFEMPNGTRKSSDEELLYMMSAGMAYGIKNFKWFTWFTPTNYFTDAILNAESGKGEMFEGGARVNAKIHAMSPYLANSDAIDVYHTDETAYTTLLPKDFIFGFDAGTSAIVSVFRDRTTGKNTVGIVNKNFNTASDTTIRVNVGSLASELAVIDSDGNRTMMPVNGGTIELTFAPGDIKLIELPEGTDLYHAKTGNLALGAGIWASSSVLGSTVESGVYNVSAYALIDGVKDSGYWMSADGDHNRFITVLPGEAISFNEITLYEAVGENVGASFPSTVEISVSDDNVNYVKIAEISAADLADGSVTVHFDTVTASYIKLTPSRSGANVAIGEIEIYCK